MWGAIESPHTLPYRYHDKSRQAYAISWSWQNLLRCRCRHSDLPVTKPHQRVSSLAHWNCATAPFSFCNPSLVSGGNASFSLSHYDETAWCGGSRTPRKTIWDNNTHWYDLQTLVHLPFVNLIEMSGCASMILRKNVKMWRKSLALSEIKRNVTFFTAE